MDLAQRYQHVGILGAGGKMGSGIALLLTQEMVLRKVAPEGRKQPFRLVLMDVSDAALDGLKGYLRGQMLRFAEKSMVQIRALYADRQDLVENGEIIDNFIDEALDLARYSTCLESLAGCRMVFEAIAENIDLKVKIYRKLKDLVDPDAYFFTNTSSIPIHLLDKEAGLGGRMVGFHFYNPPAVQKLLELITAPETQPQVVADAKQVAKDLKKTIIPANDIAGFIGNGHFIRDGLHGIALAERLTKEHGFPGAIYMVNRITQDWMIRPMGIFQLIDYVGVDVFQCILGVMDRFIVPEDLHSDLIDELMNRGVRGGQNPDGSQKDGFFRYEKGKPVAVYDFEKRAYQALDSAWVEPFDRALGALPASHAAWKVLSRDAEKDRKLKEYFANLAAGQTTGCKLAAEYLKRSKEIGTHLLKSGVAAKPEDVNGVLLNGFFHLYGPINEYI
ncbi:MAG: 3-hydroxyacyl-CoA dehydrogenase family protein [Candidatus Eisenbacteria bacterium]|nr:3-hydroxyacyl-CoA dehydrogenase family protein [Candidatus Eisenbacteria bacterium]